MRVDLAGDTPDGATVLMSEPAYSATLPIVGQLEGRPVSIQVVGGEIGAQGAKLTRSWETPRQVGLQFAFAYLDGEAWTPVPSELSADRRTLTAIVKHFSVWDTLSYNFNNILSVRTKRPECDNDGDVPAWVASVSFLDDQNAPLRYCVGRDPKDPEIVVVRVRANRAYGFALRTAAAPTWAYSHVFAGIGPQEFLVGGLNTALTANEALRSLRQGVALVPPDSGVDLGFTEERVRSAGTGELITLSPEPTFLLAGLLYRALEDSLGKDNALVGYAFALISAEQCVADAVSIRSLSDGLATVLSCLDGQADAARTATIDALVRYTDLDTVRTARAANVAFRAVKALLAANLGAQLAEFLADLRMDEAALSVQILPIVRPRLANRSARASLEAFVSALRRGDDVSRSVAAETLAGIGVDTQGWAQIDVTWQPSCEPDAAGRGQCVIGFTSDYGGGFFVDVTYDWAPNGLFRIVSFRPIGGGA